MEKIWVAKRDEVTEGRCKIVQAKGIEYGLFEVNGEVVAWRNVCPHFGAPVCKGVITGTRLPSLVYEYNTGRDNEILRCPWHGWEFDLTNGEHLVDPTMKLRRGKLDNENLEKGELETNSEDIYLWV